MRKLLFLYLLLLLAACKKDAATITTPASISSETLAKIEALGFNAADVHRFHDDYIVEGDILLREADLNSAYSGPILRVGGTEQYRTTNLISGLPRTITVRVASSLGSAYVAGTDTAIARYNRQHLLITFIRITSGTADITISGFNEGPSGGYITLGYSGFPVNGNPYSSISLNTNSAAYGSNPNILFIASVIQHELGHCIGFRHTDYFSRISCGGTPSNEGTAGVGAIAIPGTPTTADANSWMLACSNGGNRTFNANDIIALNYLY